MVRKMYAHYGKGYDFQFIAEWLIEHGVKPYIIHNGQKIIQMEVKCDYNIRFIDSISFTLMPLRDFPKTFGLTEITKGYFPHKFNTAKSYYGYDEMKNSTEKFLMNGMRQHAIRRLTLNRKCTNIVRVTSIYSEEDV